MQAMAPTMYHHLTGSRPTKIAVRSMGMAIDSAMTPVMRPSRTWRWVGWARSNFTVGLSALVVCSLTLSVDTDSAARESAAQRGYPIRPTEPGSGSGGSAGHRFQRPPGKHAGEEETDHGEQGDQPERAP